MLRLKLGDARQPLRRVLCLGAHCDDIEIGCGGTMLRLLKENPQLQVCWVVFSSNHERAEEARKSASMFLKGAKQPIVHIKNFRDGFFPFVGAEIKEFFEELKGDFSPDIVFTHFRHDLHQDHRLICELTWNTFRDHAILEYEIPKYDGDLGTPNFFVHLSDAHVRRKIGLLLKAFSSQRRKRWFTEDTFRALMRLRGMESNSLSRFAEAYHARKVVA